MRGRQPWDHDHVRVVLPRVLRNAVCHIIEFDDGEGGSDLYIVQLSEHAEDGEKRVDVEEGIGDGGLHYCRNTIGQLDQT